MQYITTKSFLSHVYFLSTIFQAKTMFFKHVYKSIFIESSHSAFMTDEVKLEFSGVPNRSRAARYYLGQ